MDSQPRKQKRQDELKLFLFLTVILAPIFSIMLIGSWGLVVWISQMIFGPPGV